MSCGLRPAIESALEPLIQELSAKHVACIEVRGPSPITEEIPVLLEAAKHFEQWPSADIQVWPGLDGRPIIVAPQSELDQLNPALLSPVEAP
jgi:hypothetical protein